MSTTLKPIILFGHARGPNPWKVQIILDELSLPYINKLTPPQDPQFVKQVNPNGRLPGIIDPNQGGSEGIKVFESGAIIQYLLTHYDTSNKLQYPPSQIQERAYEQSWLHFQMSGQGPYFGQYFWFKYHHPEKDITSALTRYENEIKRVWSVVDSWLKERGTKYLVGDRVSYADLSWIVWNNLIVSINLIPSPELTYPHFWKWHQSLIERPSVKKMMKDREEAIADEKK